MLKTRAAVFSITPPRITTKEELAAREALYKARGLKSPPGPVSPTVANVAAGFYIYEDGVDPASLCIDSDAIRVELYYKFHQDGTVTGDHRPVETRAGVRWEPNIAIRLPGKPVDMASSLKEFVRKFCLERKAKGELAFNPRLEGRIYGELDEELASEEFSIEELVEPSWEKLLSQLSVRVIDDPAKDVWGFRARYPSPESLARGSRWVATVPVIIGNFLVTEASVFVARFGNWVTGTRAGDLEVAFAGDRTFLVPRIDENGNVVADENGVPRSRYARSRFLAVFVGRREVTDLIKSAIAGEVEKICTERGLGETVATLRAAAAARAGDTTALANLESADLTAGFEVR